MIFLTVFCLYPLFGGKLPVAERAPANRKAQEHAQYDQNGFFHSKILSKLADINISEHMNDKQLEDSINWFDSKYGKRYVFEKLLDAQQNNDLRDIDDIARYYNDKIDGLQKRYDNIKNSRSYRIGRFITLPVRKIKSLIQ